MGIFLRHAAEAAPGGAAAANPNYPGSAGTAVDAEGLLETSVPGIFAAGDVRSGSIKRCATAVGEGAMAVQFVHGRLAALSRARPTVSG